MSLLHILTYFSVLIFLIMIIARAIRIASAPIHLRWELYPVPHEKGRSSYGGSHMEEPDWWTKKPEKDPFGELKVMIPEIILLKGVWEHNRGLWFGSFPLHFGLYLLIGNAALAVIAAIMTLAGAPVGSDAAGFAGFLASLMVILTWAGGVLGLFGSVVMMFKRLFDRGLSNFATPSHYFNLVLLGAIFLTALGWVATADNFAAQITSYYAGMLTAAPVGDIAAFGYWNIGASIFFVLYLPFTHMTHFFTKYFTYHKVRWEDEPNLPGGVLQERINKQLNYPVSWSAPHIGADGKKTWLMIATTNPWEKKDVNKTEE
jgi:nitrate reductase gamma subunit